MVRRFGGGDPSVFLLRFVFLPASSPKNRPRVVPVLVVPVVPVVPEPLPRPRDDDDGVREPPRGDLPRSAGGARAVADDLGVERRGQSGDDVRGRGNRSRPSREATRLLLGVAGTTTARGEARHVRVGGRFEARVRGEGVVVRRGVVVVVVVVVVAPVDRGDDRASVDGDLKRAAPIEERALRRALGEDAFAERNVAPHVLAEALCGAISTRGGGWRGGGGVRRASASASASASRRAFRGRRGRGRGDTTTHRARPRRPRARPGGRTPRGRRAASAPSSAARSAPASTPSRRDATRERAPASRSSATARRPSRA